MIFTRWGNEIKIIANCGKHELPEFVAPVTLVQVLRIQDSAKRYQFIEFLRADEGIGEILSRCPREITVLPQEQLASALQQAS